MNYSIVMFFNNSVLAYATQNPPPPPRAREGEFHGFVFSFPLGELERGPSQSYICFINSELAADGLKSY